MTDFSEVDKRFDEIFEKTIRKIIGDCEYWNGEVDEEKEILELKSFLHQEIERAVAEERKQIIKDWEEWTDNNGYIPVYSHQKITHWLTERKNRKD